MMQPSTFLLDMAEAAARSLALAALVGLGLALLRTRNVVAQKAAWMLVLVAAAIMPLLAPLGAKIPGIAPAATILVPQSWRTEVVKTHEFKAADLNGVGEAASPYTYSAVPAQQVHRAAAAPVQTAGAPHFPAPSVSFDQLSASMPAAERAAMKFPSLDRADLALLAYLAVCALLLVRLALGLWAALMVWNRGERLDGTFPGLRVRMSRGVSSPVTIGSGIVLPAGALHWDSEKLRIVLAHEASHVRQRDFYLQILCSLYSALFWFSPLGWWLKRKLSDLSETISDGAAVSHAASHVSYAQVLLEFAAMPRPVPIGVAMANHGRVTSRIEHVLNESRFRQAFAGGRARLACAIAVVAVAVCGATLVRVQAATRTAAPIIAQTSSAPAAIPAAAGSSAQLQNPEAVPAPPMNAPAQPAAAPAAPASTTSPDAPAAAPAAPSTNDATDDGVTVVSGTSTTTQDGRVVVGAGSTHVNRHGYAYAHSSNGDSYAIISGNSNNVTFSGDWFEGRKAELDKARSMAHGNDFLWFTRNGKSYVMDDPATVAQLKEMYKPMEDLGRQQEALGKQQEALGKQQEELGRKQEQASVPTPGMTKEMADVEKAVAALKAAKGQAITQDKLADMQGKLAELQAKLGELQGRIGAQLGELGSRQGRLGALQGELGAKQGKLGAEQGRLAVEADKKVKAVIDESLTNGKARPVE